MSHLEHLGKPELKPINAFPEIRACLHSNSHIDLNEIFSLMRKYKCLDQDSPDYQKCYDYVHEIISQILKAQSKVNKIIYPNSGLPNIPFTQVLNFCKATQDFTWLDLCVGLTINNHKELSNFIETTTFHSFKNLRILSIEDITLATDQVVQLIKLIKSAQIKTVVFTNKLNSKHESFLEAIPDLNLIFLQ